MTVRVNPERSTGETGEFGEIPYRENTKYGEIENIEGFSENGEGFSENGEGFSENGEGFSKNGEGFSDDPEYFTKMNLHHLSSKITEITEKNFVIICLIK